MLADEYLIAESGVDRVEKKPPNISRKAGFPKSICPRIEVLVRGRGVVLGYDVVGSMRGVPGDHNAGRALYALVCGGRFRELFLRWHPTSDLEGLQRRVCLGYRCVGRMHRVFRAVHLTQGENRGGGGSELPTF